MHYPIPHIVHYHIPYIGFDADSIVIFVIFKWIFLRNLSGSFQEHIQLQEEESFFNL